ncbi:hypothetical protein FQR65_LT09877 [Abscondita terminalis]|nr:hypothetical protein FQR65_LT09877 [Abscondita terminalis]
MYVFTSDPQAPGNNCGLMLKEFLSFGDCFASTPIYLPKIFRKYTNCVVTYVSWTSRNVEKLKLFEVINFLLKTAVNKLNLSLKMINGMNTSYTYNMFTIFSSLRKSLEHNTYTLTFFSDNMVWIVPFPARIPDMKVMQVVFKKIVWILILAASVFTSLIWWLITKVLNRNSNIIKTFLDVYSITLFGSVHRLDLISSLRCLFLAYVLYAIHIQTGFTSKLIEVLTIPQYEPTIKTITELSDSNHTIIILEGFHSYFFEHKEPNYILYNKIKQKLKILNGHEFGEKVTNLKTFRNKAALISSNELDVLTATFLTDFYTINEQTFVSNIDHVLVGHPSSYLIRTLDQLISQLVETGILDYFAKNVKYEISIKRERVNDEPTKLSLQHLYVVFVFWGAGLVLSMTVMVIELVYRVFSNDESLIYLYNGEDNFPVAEENARILYDVRTRLQIPSAYRNYSQNYVVVANDYNTLVNIFLTISRSKFWHIKLTSTGTFLVVTFEEDMENKVKMFWLIGIINVVFLVYNSEGTMYVFTTDPQATGNNCGQMLKEFLSFDDCSASTPIQLPQVLRKYNNCVVTYVSSTSGAGDVKNIKFFEVLNFLLKTMVNKLNLSLQMMHILNTNFTYNVFTIFSSFRKPLEDNPYTFTFFSDDMVWIVPFPRKIPHMKIIQLVFKKIVWILILTAFVFTSLIWWLIAKVLNRNSNIIKTFLDVYSITLFGSVHRLDLIPSLRCLFMAYVLYAIHIQTGFTSKLVEVLTIPQNKAALLSSNELDILTATFLADFYIIKKEIFASKIEYVLGGHPRSYLIRTIDKLISQLVETGILDYISKNVKYKTHIKTERVYDNAKKLSLKHLYVVFVFWGVGLGLSTTVMVFELVYRVFSNNESLIYLYDGKVKFPVAEEIQEYYTTQNYVVVAHQYNDLVLVFGTMLHSKLWHKKLTRVGTFLVVTFEEDMAKKVKMFWLLATGNNCGQMLKEFLTFDDCFASTPIQLAQVLRKYTNCVVTYVSWSSDDVKNIKFFEVINFLLKTIVNKLNLSLQMINALNTNYTYNMFTIFSSLRKSLEHNTYTFTFFSDAMVWIVPFPQKIPDMKVIQVVFKEIVWILILAAFVSTSLIWWLITKVFNRNSNIIKTFLDVYSITLFGSVHRLDLIPSLRSLFLAYVLYAIHIQTGFTSKLVEVLTVPQYEPTIKTITELSESNHTIIILDGYRNYFFDHEESNYILYNKIKQKLEILNSHEFGEKVTDLKTFRNKAALLSSNELDVLTATFLTDFYIIKEETFVSNIEHVLIGHPSSYLIRTIDELISQLVETGILNYISKNVKYEISIKRERVYDEATKLSLQHLYVVFVFWGVGLGLSTTVMVFELVYVRIITK